MINFQESSDRFSSRVEDYTKYRPGYPPACLQYLKDTFGITKNSSLADIGSGTGILTKLLLDTGATVYAVEPNANMRAEAEKQLAGYSKFISVQGKGEATGLSRGSVDVITVAQAFHWMNPDSAKAEFQRILKPGGHTVLLWNIKTSDNPFEQGYEKIKEKFGRDYLAIRKSHEPDLTSFFLPREQVLVKFSHAILLNEEALHGQIHSSSFMPAPQDADYAEMSEEITSLFHQFQENGLVRVNYETQVHHDC